MLRQKYTALAPMLAIAIVLAVSCAQSTEPTPEHTFDIAGAISTAVAEALADGAAPPTYTPKPTSTPAPPTYTPRPNPTSPGMATGPGQSTQLDTPTPTIEPLTTVPCGPDCHEETEPIIPNIRWIAKPSVTPDGVFYLAAEILERYRFHLELIDDTANVTIYDDLDRIRTVILPPAGPDEYWTLEPGEYVAEVFTYYHRILTVSAKISGATASHRGLEACIWSAQSAGERALVECADLRTRD